MRILEIGEAPYVSVYAPDVTDFYSVQDGNAPAGTRLTLRQILTLRKRLRAGHYDLVVYCIKFKVSAPWHRYASAWKIAAEIIGSSLGAFQKLSWHLFHFFFRATATPLVVIDTQDTARITKTESFWLDRCQLWFMRELPPNHMNLFLNLDRRCSEVLNIQRQPRLKRNFAKLKPFSLGFDHEPEAASEKGEPPEKIYDVFYVGTNCTTTVRQQGREELQALRRAGLRVLLPEGHMPKPDFLRACAQSWLVWSPEGQGWDCHRHYEALLHGSVPLINTPTIERLWPFHPGEHCLYYRPEKGGLTEAIEHALRDRKALRRIADQGRAYILAHHTRSQLVRHVLASVGLLEQAGPHLLDFPRHRASSPKSRRRVGGWRCLC